jgi:hypothetical protein
MAGNDKSRFAFDETGTRIRATVSRSRWTWLPVSRPPDRLYHGTVERFLPAIMREGLLAMKRHDVHLSATTDTRSASARGGANPSFWKWRPAPWSRRDTSSGQAEDRPEGRRGGGGGDAIQGVPATSATEGLGVAVAAVVLVITFAP